MFEEWKKVKVTKPNEETGPQVVLPEHRIDTWRNLFNLRVVA